MGAGGEYRNIYGTFGRSILRTVGVVVVRVTNKQGKPLRFQMEPTGDMAPPLQPDDLYEIVGQSYRPEYYVFQIDIEEEGLRVWVEGSGEGQAFHNGTSITY